MDFGFDQSRSDLLRAAGQGMVERTCENRGERSWSEGQFRQVIVACATFDQYPAARFRPDEVDLGRLNRHTNDLQRRSDETGLEFGRTFLVDIGQKKLLYGRTYEGGETGVRGTRLKQPGRAHLQRLVASVHVHPRQHLMEGRVNPFSSTDFKSLVTREEQIFDLLSMGDHTLMTLKTSVTPRNPPTAMVKELTDGIVQEFTISHGGNFFWRGIRGAIRANKEICLALGLMFILEKLENH